MIERENTLDALIKQINMNGGKTSPLVSKCFDILDRRIIRTENVIESDVFKQATFELYTAGCELSNIRGKYKRDQELLKALSIGYVTSVICLIVFLAVQYG